MLLGEGLKLLVQRRRPFLVGPFVDWSGYSFPSGHTVGATLLYGTLVAGILPQLSARRHRAIVVLTAAILVLGVAFSRVALGVHYLTDVLGGLGFGSIWLGVCLLQMRMVRAWRIDARATKNVAVDGAARSGRCALLTAMLVEHGAGHIARAVVGAGWALAVIVAFHFAPSSPMRTHGGSCCHVDINCRCGSCCGCAGWERQSARCCRQAQVGGDVVRGRLAATRGVPVSAAAASVVADITLSLFAQIAVTLAGLGLLAHLTRHTELMAPAAIGTSIAVMAVAGFYIVQRLGLFRGLVRLISRILHTGNTLEAGGVALDREVRGIYARPRAVAGSILGTIASWILAAVEIWIAMLAIGLHRSFSQAFVLESVSQGVRAVMFLIPAALGVQEGSYVVIGALLGIPADAALALAMLRRARELAIGLPGLILWEIVEGEHLWRRGAAKREIESSSIRPITSSRRLTTP